MQKYEICELAKVLLVFLQITLDRTVILFFFLNVAIIFHWDSVLFMYSVWMNWPLHLIFMIVVMHYIYTQNQNEIFPDLRQR